MNSVTTYEIVSNSSEDTLNIGRTLGRELIGGEVIELVSDLGGGKTTLVRGIAEGIESIDQVQSPTFTISRIYRGRDELEIHHFDFHRLDDAGILATQLEEILSNPRTIVALEWAEVVKAVLPEEYLQISLDVVSEEERLIRFEATGKTYHSLLKKIKKWLG